MNYVILVMQILQGLRETPIPNTSKDYIKIYSDCWNIEPANRPTINKIVDELKAIIIKENIIIKDFHIYDNNKDIQSSNNNQPNLDAKISENSYSFHESSFQDIDFTMTESKEIESLVSSNNQSKNGFDVMVNDIINFLENSDNNIVKQEILNYLNNNDIPFQDIHDLLLDNQNNSDYIFLLGKFNHLGIGADINKKQAFELYQKAADLENAKGINSLGLCYGNGIGTDINKEKGI
ncbi:hypothetical protein RclHR1_07390010 [Rhizophagus clarus]|nr:hypothetical protein RclHR1_07390010 [Rhizophagus clarus]